MAAVSSDLLVEFGSLLFYTLVAAALTIGGLVVEYASIQHFSAGDVTIALWLAAVGALLLYAGLYGVGYGKVVGRLSAE